MRRMTFGVLALVVSLVQASAATSAGNLTFVGKPLVAKYSSLGAQGGLIEFVPPNETIEGWTRLVGYRAFLDSRQSPSEAAATLARQAREHYPRDRYPESEITVFGRGTEAITEVSIVMPDATVEYNAFRFAVGPGGRGFVSLQYGRRLRGQEVAAMPREAARWAVEIARFDMNRVRAAFAQPRE